MLVIFFTADLQFGNPTLPPNLTIYLYILLGFLHRQSFRLQIGVIFRSNSEVLILLFLLQIESINCCCGAVCDLKQHQFHVI